MRVLASYRLAIAASILAMILPPGSLIGLPFGIWALVVLTRPEVRAAFKANRLRLRGGVLPHTTTAFWYPRRWKKLIFRDIPIALLVALGLRLFVVAPYRVTNDAVSPEIPKGSLLVVFKLAWSFSPGDIVVYRQGSEKWTGRVIQAGPMDGLVQIERRSKTPASVAVADIIGKAIFSTHGSQTPTVIVTGKVTDALTGRPIVGARVDDNRYGASPTQAPQYAWTDANGNFLLKTWYEEHTIAASAPGYKTKLETLLTKPFGKEKQVRMDFKLQPDNSGETLVFGPVIERVVIAVAAGRDCFLDLDTGKLFTPPDEIVKLFAAEGWIGRYLGHDSTQMQAWLRTSGVDVMAGGGEKGLTMFGGLALEALQPGGLILEWDRTTAEQVVKTLWAAEEQLAKVGESKPFTFMRVDGNLPKTFLFRTREGSLGVLQITGFTDNPPGVKIRYKLVQDLEPGQAAAQKPVFGPAQEVRLHDIGDRQGAGLFDIDSGKVFAPEPDLNQWPRDRRLEFIRSKGVDLMLQYHDQWGLITPKFGAIRLVMVASSLWDGCSKEQLDWELDRSDGGIETLDLTDAVMYRLGKETELPVTFAFATANGSRGLLQIIALTRNPNIALIRFKLLQEKGLPDPPSPEKPLRLLRTMAAFSATLPPRSHACARG